MSELPYFSLKLCVAERHIRDYLITLPRAAKKAFMILSDALGLTSCVFLSVWLLTPSVTSSFDLTMLASTTFIITCLVARQLGFYVSIVRYVGMGLVFASIKVVLVSTMVLAALALLSGMAYLSAKLAIVYAALLLIYLLGSRFAAQYFLIRRDSHKEPVVIYGAGEAGAQTALALQNGATFVPVAFVDDDATIHRNIVSGLCVHSPDDLDDLIGQFVFDDALIDDRDESDDLEAESEQSE